jgi:hypothetical protein
LKLLCIHDASARRGGQKSPHHYVAERLKVLRRREGHKPENTSPSLERRRCSKGCAVGPWRSRD